MLSSKVISAISVLSSLASAQYGGQQNIVAHSGVPQGFEQVNGGINYYIAAPPTQQSDVALIYLTDVFGINLTQNRLLVDSFARAGFLTIAPDLFNGNPAPNDINIPGFNTTEFLARATTNVTDPIIESAVTYLREEVGVQKIAVTGYCFGGKYSVRFLAEGRGVDMGFAAHPSNLLDEEVQAVTKPLALGLAEVDNLFPQDRVNAVTTILTNSSTVPWSSAVYSGTGHGFAVRGNVSVPDIKFGKEEAFYQAVRFFNAYGAQI